VTLSNIDSTLDEALSLLNDLSETQIDDLNFEFDPENILVPAGERDHDDFKRRRMFRKDEMVQRLGTHVDTYTSKIKGIGSEPGVMKDIADTIQDIKLIEMALTKEEEELFEGITNEDLVELAAMAKCHNAVTTEVSHQVSKGGAVDKELLRAVSQKLPTKGPRRKHLHLDDEDIDMDVSVLMDALDKDSDTIFFVKIHNITLEKYIMYGIFDKLKSTKSMKHLALTNVGLNDEKLLTLVEILKQNTTIETLNLESNIFTNHGVVPLLQMLLTHPTIREVKLSHQKFSLGTRGEEAMASLIVNNPRVMKIGYGFTIQTCRSDVDRAMIRNHENERQKRARGEEYYNYPEEIKRRNAHPQPWVKTQEARTERMKLRIAQQKVRMKCIPLIGMMRAQARVFSDKCGNCGVGKKPVETIARKSAEEYEVNTMGDGYME